MSGSLGPYTGGRHGLPQGSAKDTLHAIAQAQAFFFNQEQRDHFRLAHVIGQERLGDMAHPSSLITYIRTASASVASSLRRLMIIALSRDALFEKQL